MMAAFRAYFKKEILESIRQYKYLIIGVGILLFAILDPIMMKLLPEMLKNQPAGKMVSLDVFTNITKQQMVQDYIKDLFQIGSMFVVFDLSTILSGEITSQRFVFPYSKGSSPCGIVLAKFLHYSITTVIFTFLGFLLNYYYVNILFKKGSLNLNEVLSGACLISVYMVVNICLVIFFSSMIRKGMLSGIIVLAIDYFTVLLANVKVVSNFLPYSLINSANKLSLYSTEKNIFAMVIMCIILLVLSVARMGKVEISK